VRKSWKWSDFCKKLSLDYRDNSHLTQRVASYIKFFQKLPTRTMSWTLWGSSQIKGMSMKQVSFLLFSLSLLLVGCSESSKKSNNSGAYINPICAQNPYDPSCSGYTGGYSGGYAGGYTGGYTGGYYTGGYSGGTSGTSTGGTSGGSGGGYTAIPSDNNWQSLYQEGVPQGSCSSPTGTGYDLRIGTITLAGGMMYSPANPWGSMGDTTYSQNNYTHNNSDYLVSTSSAKQFFATDARLKVRFKVRPQPAVSKSQGTWCLGRQTGMAADTYGYKSLKFAVSLKPVNQDGSLSANFVSTKYVSAGVNSCSGVADFSGLSQNYPYGVVVVVHDVQSDQSCWYGSNCTAFGAVRSASCWQMDMQVSVDGTKDIN
jgi:hypothetical protein